MHYLPQVQVGLILLLVFVIVELSLAIALAVRGPDGLAHAGVATVLIVLLSMLLCLLPIGWYGQRRLIADLQFDLDGVETIGQQLLTAVYFGLRILACAPTRPPHGRTPALPLLWLHAPPPIRGGEEAVPCASEL
jgi:hypothetical protein